MKKPANRTATAMAPVVAAAPGGKGEAAGTGATMRLGRLVSGSEVGALLVDFDGSGGVPCPARSTLAIDAAILSRAVATGRGAVLLFENGDLALPVVIGLLDETPAAALFGDLLVRPADGKQATSTATPTEARLDGQRVVLEGKHEVVLKCGEASITLRKDGKILVRGAYIETNAAGVNRIKGGAVKIN